MKIEVVYFVQQGDAGPIKIGRTRNFLNRLDHMASGNSCELNVRALVPGGLELETLLHDRFSAHRMRGEWFHPHPTVLEYIASLPDVLLRDLKYRRKKRKGLTLQQAREVWADPDVSSPQARAMIGWGNAKIGRVLGWTRPVGRQRQGMKTATTNASRKGKTLAKFEDGSESEYYAAWRNLADYPRWEDLDAAFAAIDEKYGHEQPFTRYRASRKWPGGRKANTR